MRSTKSSVDLQNAAVTAWRATRSATGQLLAVLCLCLGGIGTRPCTAVAMDGEAIAQIATQQTLAIAQIDLDKVQLPPLESLRDWQSLLKQLRQTVQGQPLFVAFDLPYASGAEVARIMLRGEGVSSARLNARLQQLPNPWRSAVAVQHGPWIAIHLRQPPAAPTAPQPAGQNGQAVARLQPAAAGWDQVAAGSETWPVELAMRLPDHVRMAFQELNPVLPDAVGGGSSRPLVDALRWGRLGWDPQTMAIQWTVQADDEQAARQLATQLPARLQALGSFAQRSLQLPESPLSAMAGLGQWQVKGSRIEGSIQGPQATAQILDLMHQLAEAAGGPMANRRSMDNIKRLLLAMHNYESTFRTLPPHTRFRDAQGHSGLSWRVHLLPFLDEVELYREFHLDEAWDSPHNRPLMDRMPAVFAPVLSWGASESVPANHTLYAAPVGEQTAFGGDKAVTFSAITDGLSNTVFIVEVAPQFAVPWTAPEELSFDPEVPADKLYSRDGRTALVGKGDGSVHALARDNSPQVWRGLFTINGGETDAPR